MKRSDQYLELSKENKQNNIPIFLKNLSYFRKIEEIFKNNQNDVEIAVIARYQLYIYLKKNELILQVKDNVRKKNIDHFFQNELEIKTTY